MNIEKIWNKLVENENVRFFTTVEKIGFTYKVSGDRIEIYPDTGVDYKTVYKDDFAEVITKYWPLKRVRDLPERNIGGRYFPRSYVYALLKDSRII